MILIGEEIRVQEARETTLIADLERHAFRDTWGEGSFTGDGGLAF